MIEHRAFPLRPAPVPPVPFKGTYREAGWQRCGQMSSVDGITFTPWPHATMPNWSMPALEAAKCVARQGDELFERVHPRLYEAYFTRSLNIADPRVVADIVAAEGVRSIPTVIVPETGRALVGLVDATMYRAAVEEAAG